MSESGWGCGHNCSTNRIHSHEQQRWKREVVPTRRPPTPPPRDPTGINTILQHVEEEKAQVMQLVKNYERSYPYSRDRCRSAPSPTHLLSQAAAPSSARSAAPPRSLPSPDADDGDDSESSESSSSFSWRDTRVMVMDPHTHHIKHHQQQHRSSTPSRLRDSPRRSSFGIVSRGESNENTRRCSSYENVRDEGRENPRPHTPGFYPSKPPPASYPSSRPSRVISNSSPVPGDGTLPHRYAANCDVYHPATCASPLSFPNAPSSSSSNGFRSCRSGSNTPVLGRIMSAVTGDDSEIINRRVTSVRSPLCETDNLKPHFLDGLDGDSTDSDPVRRRPPTTCKAPRSHRGSLPGDCQAWHGSCSPCCNNLRFHWYGETKQNSCWRFYPGYSPHSSNGQIDNFEELQEKICKLESEKEHLVLQVNVLSEQVEAQNEKIIELEATLTQNKEQLNSSEAMLRQEMSSRSSLENSKLDLMAEVSNLRLRLATAEQERDEIEERCNKLESELVLACARLAEKEADLATLKSKIARNGTVTPIPDYNSELDKLKGALSSVMAANDEKEKKIQELQISLNRYKRLQEVVFSGHGKKDSTSAIEANQVPLTDIDVGIASETENMRLTSQSRLMEKPPPVPRQMPPPTATSSPIPIDSSLSPSREGEISRCSPLLSPFESGSQSPFISSLSQRANSTENVSPPTPQKTPPAKRHYGTMPRQHTAEVLQQIQQQLHHHQVDQNSNSSPSQKNMDISSDKTSQSFHNLHHPSLDIFRPVRTKASGVSFGKGFFRLKSGKRSSSAPELALPEVEATHEAPDTIRSTLHVNRGTPSPLTILDAKEKPKGIKKIFGKLKRTGSENLDASEAEFRRGGIRATAGPRLGWSREMKAINNTTIPFAQWNNNMIADWLHSIGLGMYVTECKKWGKSGEHLLKATPHEFEKELGIKNMLHRKKLQLAVSAAGAGDKTGSLAEAIGKVDYQWIIRWLDDVGLPQYKDAFFDARVDGRVLHHMTVEDLFTLKVTNQLHHISIKRGIQVLRENNFNTHFLKRRSLPDDEHTPLEVAKWTNHRVMEWLRTVDLSEYAPNLRGSGVHGSLMVYEPRFNADLMATLLNIPPNKTLLRRHLSTQFKQLVGVDLMQKKREWESQPNYIPLSPSAKIKAVRRGQFSLMRKRNKLELEFEDYVCPMDLGENSALSPSPMVKSGDRKSNEVQQKQEHISPIKKEETNAASKKDGHSKDINSITNLLEDEKLFENMATTNV